jgi:hypothetical protein
MVEDWAEVVVIAMTGATEAARRLISRMAAAAAERVRL